MTRYRSFIEASSTSIGGSYTDTTNVSSATVLVGSTVNFSEALNTPSAGTYGSVLTCPTGVTVTGNSIVMPNADVTCTYTNTNTPASVVVNKAWNINGTAYTNGNQPAGYSSVLSLTGQATPAFGTTYPGYAVGQKINVGETATVPANCTNTPSGDAGPHTLVAGLNSYSITNTVTCTAAVTLKKVWADGSHPDDTVTLTINGGSPVTPVAPNAGSTSTTVSVNSSVTVAETPGLMNAATYTPTLTCDNGVVPVSGSFTMPNANVTCTYTNTPKTATLKVQKDWEGNPIAGDTAALQVNLVTQATSTSDGSNGIDTGNIATVTVMQGQSVNVAEVLGIKNSGVYTHGAPSCPGVTVSENGTFQMPQTDVTCTFVNTAQQTSVTLTKTWVGGVAGDTAGLSINGSTPNAGSTSTATGGNQTDTTHKATATLSRGSTVTLSEQLGGTGTYTPVYTCSSGTTSVPVSGTNTFQMPITGDVTCVVTNTAATAAVTLTKEWVDGVAGDTAVLSIASPGAATGTNSSTSAGTPGSVTDSAHTASATVSRGAQVTLSESLAPKKGAYTSTYVCTGATVSQTTGVFTMPTTGTVDCTVTNTAATGTVTLTKTWVGGVAGDVANLTIAVPGSPEATSASTATGGNQTDATGAATTVAQGASVTLGETVDPSAGSYTATYECTDSTGTVSVTSGFTMPAGNVTCVVTNTAATNTVTLTKTWVGGVKSDTAALTIAGPSVSGATAYTSTAAGGNQTDTTGASATASTGSIVTLAETLTGSGTYGQAYACSDGSTPISVGNDRTFTMPTSGDVSCVVTNTAVTASVSLFKDWVAGVAGDTAGLIINGSTPDADSTSTATGGNQSDRTQFAAATVSTGSVVSLSENRTGNGDYAPVYTCTDGEANVPVDGNNSFTMPAAGTVVCIVTNTAATGTVTLTKTWTGGVQGDAADLSIAVQGLPDASYLSTAAGGDQTDATGASETVSRGAQVTLGETLTGAGVYTADYVCTIAGEPVTGTVFTMPSSGDVACVVTNTAATAQVTLTKVWVDGVQGDAAGLSITSPGAAAGTSSSTSTGAPGTVTDSANTASATVSRGAQVTLSESLDPKSGTYTSTYACTGATVPESGGVFQMPTTGTVDCTVTNTAKTAQATLTKTWVGGVAGDAANLSIAIPGAPTSGYVSTATGGNQTDATGATATSPEGATVTIGESLDPSNGTYTPKYVCTDESGPVTLSDNGFSMPAVDVSCVVTNTAATGMVTLTKTWVPGVAGDKGNLTIAVPGTQSAAYTSTAVGGNQTDQSGASATVSTGSTLTLGEKIDPAKGSYTSTYSCTDSAGAVALSSNGFTMPAGTVNCVITNTAPVPVTPVTPVTPGMADTGSNVFGPLGLGGILLALGAVMVFWMRRRRLQG